MPASLNAFPAAADLLQQYKLFQAAQACKPVSLKQVSPARDFEPRESVDITRRIRDCGRQGQWSQALSLLHGVRTKGFKLSAWHGDTALSALEKAGGRWRRALAMLTSSRRVSCALRVISFNSAMSCCEKAGGHWDWALELLQTARRLGIEPDRVSYDAAASSCGKEAAEDLEWAAGEKLTNLRRRWSWAVEMLREATSGQGLEVNTIIWNALLAALRGGPGASWKQALRVLGLLRCAGLQPDTISMNSAITVCEKDGEWEAALGLLLWGVAQSLRADVLGCNAAISACGQGGQWDHAMSLLWSIRASGLTPTHVTLGAALSAADKAGQWKVALLLSTSGRPGIAALNAVSIGAALDACERGGCWEVALDMVGALRLKNLGPDREAFSAAVGACSRASRWQETLEMLTRAVTASSGERPGSAAWIACLRACSGTCSPEAMQELLQSMRQSFATPDLLAHSAALSSHRQAQGSPSVAAMLGEVKLQGRALIRTLSTGQEVGMWRCAACGLRTEDPGDGAGRRLIVAGGFDFASERALSSCESIDVAGVLEDQPHIQAHDALGWKHVVRNKVYTYMIERNPEKANTNMGRFVNMFTTVIFACVLSAPGNELRGYCLQPPNRALPFGEFFKPDKFVRSTSVGALIMAVSLGVGTLATPQVQKLRAFLREHLKANPVGWVLLLLFALHQALESRRHNELVEKVEGGK